MNPDTGVAFMVIGGIIFISGYMTAHNQDDEVLHKRAFIATIVGLLIFFAPIFYAFTLP